MRAGHGQGAAGGCRESYPAHRLPSRCLVASSSRASPAVGNAERGGARGQHHPIIPSISLFVRRSPSSGPVSRIALCLLNLIEAVYRTPYFCVIGVTVFSIYD